ncbi:MAG: tryptophan-rich sensory protein [Acidobacteria bacterium]|nr:tryptophan-rich sensory protein [Acidobacteriota bacterium]
MFNQSWAVLGLFLVICFSAAGLGAVFTASSVKTWYQLLRKPSLTPPDWVFGPVWTVLYFLMALSAWLVWRNAGWSAARAAFLLFFLQIICNVIWSGLFFGMRRPGLAYLDVLVLLSTIIATAMVFRVFSSTAFCLMLIYAAWVGFASFLNFEVWRLNPESDAAVLPS